MKKKYAGPIMKNSLTGEPLTDSGVYTYTYTYTCDLEAINELVDQLRARQRELEDLQAEIDAIKDLLKERMGSCTEFRGPNYRILYTTVESQRVDTKLLFATYPEVARACTKMVQYRRFEVR